ncbi:MAG: 4Fe-4S dicluster domain-containing protein [Planctomycetota bacterium]|nr:4Fe-4S dicluster domain-containing protein [Planctomycetota bacterium]
MAELRPYPFGALVTRMFRELEERRTIFDLPLQRFFLGDPDRDLSVRFHGLPASTPLGPAAGPQSQMAQNIVLSWLGGCRILELKTVQIDDQLVIPRPCIDMQTVGYNVEWSQELELEQSLEEYVKGSMLIEMLRASGVLPLEPGHADTLFDMSVGYDLNGIKSERVQAFIAGMLDCGATVDRLRAEIPETFAEYRDLDYRTRLSDTLTLSTFHGCPPGEIEGIIDFLLREKRLHSIVKLNPTLLGPRRTRELLNDALGYDEIRVPETAFERDTTWEQMLGFVDRLGETAKGLGLGFGVKFTNTLIVRNHRDFFPSGEKEMYLSGPPLHVLAMELVRRFRQEHQDRYAVSFSAGIDRRNFPDAVALGIVPVTVCTDLLRPGGYGRARGYFDELRLRMDKVQATSIGDFVIRAYGLGGAALDRLGLARGTRVWRACERALLSGGDLLAAAGPVENGRLARWVSEAAMLNTEHYVSGLPRDPRYAKEANSRPPRKIGSRLELFDCITCDKCVPVCPNDANFTFELPRLDVPILKVRREGDSWTSREEGRLTIAEKHQIGNFADFCNDCGNCDIFCPEDGGPYVVKPRFFGTLEDWRRFAHLDGFARADGVIHGRFSGAEYSLATGGGRATYAGAGFELSFDEADPLGTLGGVADGEVDLAFWRILAWIRDAVYASSSVSYPSLIG